MLGWVASGSPCSPPPPGTSTDVSRYAGEFEHVFEASTAGVTLQAPQLDINTVAAGGGSRLFFRSAPSRTCADTPSPTSLTHLPARLQLQSSLQRSGLFVVGPESAGAHPGPACYRKGKCWHTGPETLPAQPSPSPSPTPTGHAWHPPTAPAPTLCTPPRGPCDSDGR